MKSPFPKSFRAYGRRRRTGSVVTLFFLSLAACTTLQVPVPPAKRPAPHRPSRKPPPDAVLREQPLPEGALLNPLPPRTATAPPIVALIRPGMPPQKVAAMRLVDAARAELARNSSAAALDQLEQAISIDPNNPYAYYYLAQTHLDRGANDQAVVFAERAAVLMPRDYPSWRARAYTLVGRAWAAQGGREKARKAFVRALAADPTDRDARAALRRMGAAAEGPRP